MELTRLLRYPSNTKERYLKGDDVKEVQTILTRLGFLKDKIDGLYGPKTKSAVKAFQKANGLKVDGKVGPITWAALHPAPVELPGLVAYAAAQVGALYVSGGQGQTATPALIRRNEKDNSDYKRAIKSYDKHLASGGSLIMYDCSGLIIHYLLDIAKVIDRDLTAHGIYTVLCDQISKSELQAGDVVCKKNVSRIYHIGVYMGDGTVVHAKGRNYGVVRESINATGWNRFGRLKVR